MTRVEDRSDPLTSQLPITWPVGQEVAALPSLTSTVTTHQVLTTSPFGPQIPPTRYLKFTPMDELNYPDDERTQNYDDEIPKHRFPEVIVSPGVPRVTNEGHDSGRGGVSHPADREDNFHKVPSPPVVSVGTVTVRAEEIALVLVVLMLWAGAITLFINRWGKLRMLEPYQPAYTAPSPPPRANPSQPGHCININIQSTSDLTLCEGGAAGGYEWGGPEIYGRGSLAGSYMGMSRSPSSLSVKNLDPPRKVKSAVDLVSLVMQEKMTPSLHLAATNV